MDKLTWVEKPVKRLYGQLKLDTAHYEAEFGDGNAPYFIRVRVTNGKTFFIVSRGMQHYTTVRSLERAKAVAEANYEQARHEDPASSE